MSNPGCYSIVWSGDDVFCVDEGALLASGSVARPDALEENGVRQSVTEEASFETGGVGG